MTQLVEGLVGGSACRKHTQQVTVDGVLSPEFDVLMGDDSRLTVYLIEDGIVAAQSLPDGSKDNEYVHNHVLRDVITDVWGAEVDCTGAVGEKRMAQFDYHNVNHSLNISNCHIVALLSNRTTRQILNVAETEIKIAK